jgi:hypothetical protein
MALHACDENNFVWSSRPPKLDASFVNVFQKCLTTVSGKGVLEECQTYNSLPRVSGKTQIDSVFRPTRRNFWSVSQEWNRFTRTCYFQDSQCFISFGFLFLQP